MSNEVYDEFCKATIPNLTQLDRQVLGHYCTRFNETVTPARAWPPRAELMRITGAVDKSISRSLGRLSKRGLIVRVTLASKTRGLKGEYAINRSLIRSHIKVTEELPNTSNEVTEQSQKGNSGEQKGNSGVSVMTPSSYPKPTKPIKPNKRINVERWQIITSYLPDNVKRLIKAGQNYESLLDELVRQGTSVTAIRDKLAKENYGNGVKVGSLFNYFLETYAGGKHGSSNSPYPWCGKCGKETRQFDEPSEINGVFTHNCPNCHPLRKQLEPRTPDGVSFNNVFRDVNES